MLCRGPVRVPDDALPGPAVLRLELPEELGPLSLATDIPVELEARQTAR
jgi:hypothetical protein